MTSGSHEQGHGETRRQHTGSDLHGLIRGNRPDPIDDAQNLADSIAEGERQDEARHDQQHRVEEEA